MTKTIAAEILANPATRRRQVTMTISLNPLIYETSKTRTYSYGGRIPKARSLRAFPRDVRAGGL